MLTVKTAQTSKKTNRSISRRVKALVALISFGAIALLSGCAHQDLKAPCPNFGSTCSQENINSWN